VQTRGQQHCWLRRTRPRWSAPVFFQALFSLSTEKQHQHSAHPALCKCTARSLRSAWSGADGAPRAHSQQHWCRGIPWGIPEPCRLAHLCAPAALPMVQMDGSGRGLCWCCRFQQWAAVHTKQLTELTICTTSSSVVWLSPGSSCVRVLWHKRIQHLESWFLAWLGGKGPQSPHLPQAGCPPPAQAAQVPIHVLMPTFTLGAAMGAQNCTRRSETSASPSPDDVCSCFPLLGQELRVVNHLLQKADHPELQLLVGFKVLPNQAQLQLRSISLTVHYNTMRMGDTREHRSPLTLISSCQFLPTTKPQ